MTPETHERGPRSYSIICYIADLTSQSDVLRKVMLETSTTQSDLSRLSGVRQPSISGFLSGKVDISDHQLDRLLSCMGFRLEVVRRPVVPKLTRSERRSWQLHRRLSTLLNHLSFEEWRATIERNLDRLSDRVTGQPHERNLDRWQQLVDRGELPGLHRVLTGLDRDAIEMREVSPMSGLLNEEQRRDVLKMAG
jgi:transcriptional regulator with XRE-family HTH domain